MSDLNVMNVLITGGGGRIAYSLIPLICRGDVFGKTKMISLRLLDIEASASIIQGVKLEIDDSNYDLVVEVIATTDVEVACKDVDVAILLGGFPRLPGMERKDLISKNAEGMRNQARALNTHASRDCKVLVVANPANTNCLVAIKSAPDIPATNFSCLTRLDEERLRGFACAHVNSSLGHKGSLSIRPSAITGLYILGNHSSTQVPYLDTAKVIIDGESKCLKPFITDVESLTSRVQNRGAEIMSTLKASSAMSCAVAIEKHLQDWLGVAGTNRGDVNLFSLGILSDGNPYGVPDGLVFSFPCQRSACGKVEIVSGLNMNEYTQTLIGKTTIELTEERTAAKDFL